MNWIGLSKYRDLGLLIIRLGLGLSFVLLHGGPKLLGGPDLWKAVGSAMGQLGIHFAPTYWGFMAMFAELVGGICLILGFYFRPALGLMIITMAVAATQHLLRGDGLGVASHAMEVGIVFVGLLLTGPGKYSLDGKE